MESSPNQVKITEVSHGVHGKKRNRDVRLNPIARAGDKSRISGARKKLRLIENIVEDVRDNSRPFGVRKKLRLRLISDIVSRHVQDDSKAHKTCKGGKDFKHRKNVKLSPVLSPLKNSIKRIDLERQRKKLPTGNEIQTPETHEKSRRLIFSESKRPEHDDLKSMESREACPNVCGIAMENSCSTYDRNKIMRAAHKWELLVYNKFLWVFHTDCGTLSPE